MSLKSITVVVREVVTHTITINDFNSELGSLEGLVDTVEFVNEIRDMDGYDLITDFGDEYNGRPAEREYEVVGFELEENK